MLVLIGVAMLVQFYYFQGQDDEQEACIGDNFSALTNSLTRRADLGDQEAMAVRAESEATRLIIRGAFTSETREEVLEKYADYRVELDKVDKRRARIDAEREANPIPDFPEGTCQ